MADLDLYLSEVVRRVSAELGPDLVGVYLHGSAAMGAFVPSRSDIDILCVTQGTMSLTAKVRLADGLSETALPCPGVGLELSVVTVDSALARSDAPAFELHMSTLEGRVVNGAGRSGDPDLLAHFAMARARGKSLVGPPPQETFAKVDRSRLLRSLANDLTWAIENDLSGYAVLNACRGLRLRREGQYSSKLEGGRWALDLGIGNASLIAAALRRQGGADEEVDTEAAIFFVLEVREELLHASAG